ncbi:MAG: hypothetical protein GXO83_00645 [Chlorobi bacterium]|nr:hypothetical protein [Chlorobiota bacterium]
MKNYIIWILAILITISAAYYQRRTGPTYPRKITSDFAGRTSGITLPRSHETDENCPVILNIPDHSVSGKIIYRPYPSVKPWDTLIMNRHGDTLEAGLPAQPPAGKLAYQILLTDKDRQVILPADEPVVIRFKGHVPASVLVPHIFVMFFAMLLSSVAGLMAVWKKPRFKLYAWLTLIFLIVGGGILGPLVQKHAFGDLWTGIPFGWDLTDNKTLIALVMWIVAVFMSRRDKGYGWVIAASVVLLLVYSVPHSLFGSQFNYETGEIIQGIIRPLII